MIVPLGVDHAAVTVADLDRSLAFYRDLLGMRLLGRGELAGAAAGIADARVAWADLDAGDGRVFELIQYLRPVGAPVCQRVCDPGSGHVAVRVADARVAHAALTDAGVHVLAQPCTLSEPGRWHGVTFFYALDPDGQTVELVERPAAPA